MKELFFIKDSLANKISYYHLLLLLASLPFDRFYSHIILISLIIHTLIQYKKHSFRPGVKWQLLLLSTVFLVSLWSILYSINMSGAYTELGRQVPIVLFPLLLCFTRLDLKKYRPFLLLAFSMVCTLTVVYLYLDVFFTIRYYHLPFSSFFSSAFINHNFSAPIDMHATFFSMQLVIALVYLLSVVLAERKHPYRLFFLLCMLILAAGLVQLSAKSVCFCLVPIISFAVPIFLLPKSMRWKFLLLSTVFFVLSTLFILKLNTFKERYVNALQLDLSDSAAGESADPRLARWSAAVELIAKSPVIGYGAGSELPLLQNAWFEKKYYSSYLHRLNAHNEYLSFLLKSGIIGLLVYLATLILGLRLSLLRHDFLFFVFMLLIVFVSVSENLLDVNKGILFYSFFFSFFMFSSGAKKASPVR